jgi:hypothetical protein
LCCDDEITLAAFCRNYLAKQKVMALSADDMTMDLTPFLYLMTGEVAGPAERALIFF